jgi:hypothetical protein
MPISVFRFDPWSNHAQSVTPRSWQCPILRGASVSDPNHIQYYVMRERTSRERAETAIDPEIRRIHLEFAARYAAIVEASQPTPRPLLHVVR